MLELQLILFILISTANSFLLIVIWQEIVRYTSEEKERHPAGAAKAIKAATITTFTANNNNNNNHNHNNNNQQQQQQQQQQQRLRGEAS